jgi:hypothetical protein
VTIDPTREEWLAAMRRVTGARGTPMREITEAALGPCPPKPVPMCGRQIGDRRQSCRRPENHPDACRPFLVDGDPPTEHVRRYGREQKEE